MKITIIGTGYVGLVSGAVFADWGHDVICLDIDEGKIKKIKQGIMPIYEEGLEELVNRVQSETKNFEATTNYRKAVEHGEIIFICVGTPGNSSGAADLGYVFQAAQSIGKLMPENDYRVIVTKSTVPVGTHNKVRKYVLKGAGDKKVEFDVASNPEFLREGSSIFDANNTDRVILGSNSEKALTILESLYEHLGAPILKTDLASAELIKYAANAFLATKISFINEISQICERTGADVKAVADGMGLDKRIGPKFLNAGIGYGGSCFKPDTLVYIKNSPDLKNIEISDLVKKENEGKKINTLGFSLAERKARISSAVSLTKRQYSGQMVTVKTRMGRELEVTNDHPMLIFEDGELSVKLAGDLKVNDLIPVTSALPVLDKCDKEINTLKLIEKDQYLLNKTILEPEKDYRIFSELYAQIKPFAEKHLKYVHDIKRYNKMPLRVYKDMPKEVKRKIDLRKIGVYTVAATKIPAIVKINKNFARYIGYYLAEGHITEDFGRNSVSRLRIGITFHEDEGEYIADVERFYKSNGIKYFIRHDRKNHNKCVVVSSKVWAYLLNNELSLGKSSHTKLFPKFAFRLDFDLKLELLRGLFSGDGSLSIAHEKYPSLEYATVSKAMAYDVMLMLQSLGVVASIAKRFMNKSTRRAYIIRVSGKIQLEKIMSILGESKERKILDLLTKVKYINPIGYKHLENFNLVPVTSVSKHAYAGPVYSLETTENTVVVNSGMIVHNCFPKDVEALYRTSSENFYDFRLLRGVMDANERQKYYFMEKVWRKYKANLTGKTFGVLGAAFKNDTDDIRKSVAMDIIKMIRGAGGRIKLFDPAALENARNVLGNDYVNYADSAEEVFEDVDAVFLLTEWASFTGLDYEGLSSRMNEKVIFDGKNLLDPVAIKSYGIEYYAVGRAGAG